MLLEEAYRASGLRADERLEEHVASLVLEHWFVEVIEALEARLSVRVQVVAFRNRDARAANWHTLQGLLRLNGMLYPLALALPPEWAFHLAEALDKSAARLAPPQNFPVQGIYKLGTTVLALAAIKNLRLNDVVLMDAMAGAGMLFVDFGGWAAPAEWEGQRAVLLQPLSRKQYHELGVETMSEHSISEVAESDARFDDILVRVTFELGRTECALSELGSLAPGYVFDLGRDSRSAVEIVAGSKRIGLGEVVQIGGTLGVRVTRLFNNE